jgi:hypothetical protein
MSFAFHRIFVIIIALAGLSFAAFGQNVAFTTVNDFTGWIGDNFTLSTVTSPDLDGVVVNGLGNTTQAGSSGIGGSLRLFEAAGPLGSALAISPNEKTNSAFMSALQSAGTLTMKYETFPAANESSSTFLLAWRLTSTDNGFHGISPFSTTFSPDVTTSIYNIAGLVQGNPDWFQLGFATFANYDPSSPIYIDSISLAGQVPEPTSAALMIAGLIGLGVRSRLRH